MALQLRSPSDQIRLASLVLAVATTAKVPIVTQTRAAIPLNTAASNEQNEFVYRSEISGGPKATGEAWAPFQPIYWSAANGNFTTTAGGNTKCGFALAAALAGDTVTPLMFFDSFAP